MKKILDILWEASALKSINDMLNDESGNIISDAGIEWLEESAELQRLLRNAQDARQQNPNSEIHQMAVDTILNQIEEHNAILDTQH